MRFVWRAGGGIAGEGGVLNRRGIGKKGGGIEVIFRLVAGVRDFYQVIYTFAFLSFSYSQNSLFPIPPPPPKRKKKN